MLNDVAAKMMSDCPADVVFVLDQSKGVKQAGFDLMKSFLTQLLARMEIDNGHTRVGLVTYAGDIGEHFNLNAHSSLTSVQSAISSLTYSGGSTDTAKALRYVRTTMLTSAAGDRCHVRNVVVVLTDGVSNDKEATKVGLPYAQCGS